MILPSSRLDTIVNCFAYASFWDFLCLFLVCFIVLSFQSVLENLPGVDPQSDAIKDAVSSLSGESKKKKEDKDKDK